MAALIGILIALLAACSDDGGPLPDLRIELALDTAQGCPSADCADYPMTCGAWLSIRVVDAADPASELAGQCVAVAPADTLCALGDAAVASFLNLPVRNARFEVVVWGPDPLAEDPVCPTGGFEFFDVGEGLPRSNVMPQPAFARSVIFDLDSDGEVVTIPLACTDPIAVATVACSAQETYVRADVDGLESLVGIAVEQARDLAVFVGEPVPSTDEVSGETTWSLEPAESFQLDFIPPGVAGFAPFFEGHVPRAFGADICVAVTDLSAAETTSVVKCSREAPGAEDLLLRAILVGKETVDDIVAALGLADFPTDGLLIGRVIDHTSQPLAGVMVSPSEGTVSYLSADLATTAGLTQTSSSGYFVSRNAPFNSTFSAIHLDGRREDGAYLGGIIRGRASVLVIRMEPPL